MEPKNKPERTRAFINFLLLFILSVAIILTTVFFSYLVPVKQANDLRTQIHKVENERVIAADFLTKMSEISVMVDSVNNSGDPEELDLTIKDKIDKLQYKADNDTVYDQRLYQNIVKNMDELWKAKKQLRKLTKTDDDVKELQKDNLSLQQKLDDRTKEYNALYLQSTQHR